VRLFAVVGWDALAVSERAALGLEDVLEARTLEAAGGGGWRVADVKEGGRPCVGGLWVLLVVSALCLAHIRVMVMRVLLLPSRKIWPVPSKPPLLGQNALPDLQLA
jgi:hypothetical protein